MSRVLKLLAPVVLTLCAASQTEASTIWIGNDTNSNLPVLETSTTGTVLRTFSSFAVGFGVDVANNTLFVNNSFSSAELRDLTTLAVLGTIPLDSVISEDLSFDGTYLLAGDFGNGQIVRIDPTTGAFVSAVTIGVSQPLGLSWDGGTGFWVSNFDTSGVVYHYDSTGALLSSFVAFQGGFAGGIGYDPADGTLYVGSFGTVSHFTTGGVLLGSFSTPDNRFVDGLEVSPGSHVPEPASLLLLGTGIAAGLRARRRART